MPPNIIEKHQNTAHKPPSTILKLLSITTQGNMRKPRTTRTQRADTSVIHECTPTKQQRHMPMSTEKSSVTHHLY